MPTILEQVTTERESAVAAYRELVIQSIDATPALSKIRETLDAADRSPEQFAADVETLRHRHEAARSLEAADEMQAEIDEASKTLAAANAALADLERRHREEMLLARNECIVAATRDSAARDRQRSLRTAARHLLHSTADSSIDRELASMDAATEQAVAEIAELRPDRDEFDRIRQQQEERAALDGIDPSELAPISARHKYLRSRCAQLETIIQSNMRERREAIEARKLDPVNLRWS